MSNANDFVIENGVLKEYKGSSGDVVIPEGVTSIGDYVFFLCDSLESVTIPDGVTNIGKAVFEQLNTAKPSAKDCNAAAAYMTLFHERVPADNLQRIFEKLKQIKSGEKAVKTIEANVALMEKLGGQ